MTGPSGRVKKPILQARAAVPLLAALVFFGVPVQARAQAGDAAATVILVTGDVTWHAAGETAFQPAMGGERLFPGARIRTAAQAYAHLKWRNGGDFKLFPLSELEVPKTDGVLLNAGQVWAAFKKKLAGPFYFKAPSATAVVRGTTLGVEIRPAGDTFVAVLEGRVEVLGANGGPSRMIEPGQSVLVSPLGLFGPLQPVQPRDFDMMRRPSSSPAFGPGPGPGPGPGRPPEEHGRSGGEQAAAAPRPGGLDWLQRNRAAFRLEEARGVERLRRSEGPPAHGAPVPPADRYAEEHHPPGGTPVNHPQPQPHPQPDREPGRGRLETGPYPGGQANPGASFPTGRPPKDLERPGCYPPVSGVAQPLACPLPQPPEPRPEPARP